MDISEARIRMRKALEYIQGEYSKIRGSRANPQLIEEIKVSVYGCVMSVKQIATVTVVDPTLITIQCWDRSNIEEIKKAIESSDLGVNPSIDGDIVRVPLPPLTEERRKELVKVIKRLAEESKISIRRIRRDYLDALEKGERDEDIIEREEKEMKKLIDEYNSSIDEEFTRKEKELMSL